MVINNGADYVAPNGVNIYASHDGTVTKTYDKTNSSPTIGYGIWITHSEGWQTVYFHLQDVLVKIGDKVKAGDLIGHADNTGQYTTGSHLHFGLYPANMDKKNGYGGAISPLEYFDQEQISGTIINNTNMIVDRPLLEKLYLATFKRLPDPEADYYIGKDINEVLLALIDSKENVMYSKVYSAVKDIEKNL